MIRRMIETDIDKLIPLVIEHYNAVNMDERLNSFDLETAYESLCKVCHSMETLVNDDQGVINGIVAYAIYPSLFNKKEIKSSEFLWYSKSPRVMINLHKAIMKILNTKADVINIGIPINNDIKNYLTRNKFILTEYVFSIRGNK